MPGGFLLNSFFLLIHRVGNFARLRRQRNAGLFLAAGAGLLVFEHPADFFLDEGGFRAVQIHGVFFNTQDGRLPDNADTGNHFYIVSRSSLADGA